MIEAKAGVVNGGSAGGDLQSQDIESSEHDDGERDNGGADEESEPGFFVGFVTSLFGAVETENCTEGGEGSGGTNTCEKGEKKHGVFAVLNFSDLECEIAQARIDGNAQRQQGREREVERVAGLNVKSPKIGQCHDWFLTGRLVRTTFSPLLRHSRGGFGRGPVVVMCGLW